MEHDDVPLNNLSQGENLGWTTPHFQSPSSLNLLQDLEIIVMLEDGKFLRVVHHVVGCAAPELVGELWPSSHCSRQCVEEAVSIADNIHSFEEGSNITGDVVDLAEVIKELVIVENLTEKKKKEEKLLLELRKKEKRSADRWHIFKISHAIQGFQEGENNFLGCLPGINEGFAQGVRFV